MNGVIAGISYRALLGRRRIWLLGLLPLVLIGLALLLRLLGVADERNAITLMQIFAVSTMLPLLGLIAGTGVIAPRSTTARSSICWPSRSPARSSPRPSSWSPPRRSRCSPPCRPSSRPTCWSTSNPGSRTASPWDPSSAASRTRRCSCCWAC
ncbi:hypothetical protein ACFQX6_34960 [Streptosporangium lutulentum]